MVQPGPAQFRLGEGRRKQPGPTKFALLQTKTEKERRELEGL